MFYLSPYPSPSGTKLVKTEFSIIFSISAMLSMLLSGLLLHCIFGVVYLLITALFFLQLENVLILELDCLYIGAAFMHDDN